MKPSELLREIPNSDQSPLYDVRNPARASRKGCNVRSDVSRTIDWATSSIFNSIWWSQTGSNRRPHACKARALPAELWPRTRRRMLTHGNETHTLDQVVGLGRLELPTSRLSSARSNQLSYKPIPGMSNQKSVIRKRKDAVVGDF